MTSDRQAAVIRAQGWALALASAASFIAPQAAEADQVGGCRLSGQLTRKEQP